MRKAHLLAAVAFVGALAATDAANAQLGGIGGVAGGVTGSLGGGFGAGGLGGNLGGSIGGSLSSGGQVLNEGTRAERIARDRAARGGPASAPVAGVAAQTASGALRQTAQAAVVAPQIVAPQIVAPSVVTPQVALPQTAVDLGYLGGPRVVEVGRTQALIDAGVTVIPAGQVDVYMDRQVVELRDELRGTGVEVVRRGESLVLELPSDITFAFDKSDIRPRFYPVLDAVAHTLNQYPATYVDVVGHADAIGSDAYNQRLSERRAAAVADALVDRRALPQRLFAEGRGEREPIASNATIQGRAANRRVEIILNPHKMG